MQTDRHMAVLLVAFIVFFVAATRYKIKTEALCITLKKISIEILSNTYSGRTTRKLLDKNHTEI